MRRTLLLATILPLLCLAQQPFGKNATWHYTVNNFYMGTGFIKVEYTKDSLYLNAPWQHFHMSGAYKVKSGPGPYDYLTFGIDDDFLLKTQNDSVFYLLGDTLPQLLYDFNAQVGAHWQFAPEDTAFGCQLLPQIKVIGSGVDLLNGQQLEYLMIEDNKDTITGGLYTCASGWCLWDSKVYKHIGQVSGSYPFQPVINACNGGIFEYSFYSLRCYEDSVVGLLNFTNDDCDYLIPLHTDEENESTAISVFPNPVKDWLRIESDRPIQTIRILNIKGREVLNEQGLNSTVLAKRINLVAGIYILEIESESGKVHFQKLLIQ